jgi:translation initiation factor eIF-2B subunit delta
MSETAPPAAPAAVAAAAPAPSSDATLAPAKLTGAQLKAQKKAEKAARREQSKAAEPSATAPATNEKQSGGKQHKSKQDAPATSLALRPKKPVPTPAPAPKEPAGPVVPEIFSHLPMAKKLALPKADKDVDPAVLALGQQMATFALKDNVTRLETTLVVFKKVRLFCHISRLKPKTDISCRSSRSIRVLQDMFFLVTSSHMFSIRKLTIWPNAAPCVLLWAMPFAC